MNEKLDDVEQRFERLTADLSNPAVIADSTRLRTLSRERSSIEKLVDTYRTYKKLLVELKGNEELLEGGDAELRAMAKEELPALGLAGPSWKRSSSCCSFRRTRMTTRTSSSSSARPPAVTKPPSSPKK